MCYKELSKDEYTEWLEDYKIASTTIENRLQLLSDVYELIEKDFTLLGATGILDELQDNVPETICSLINANIRIWILTGDKIETAINIGNEISYSFVFTIVRPEFKISQVKY